MNYDLDDNGSLGYCSDPQFSSEHNISWPQLNHNSYIDSAMKVEFTEQPADYRYRYLKEKYHGHIVGVSSPLTKKKDLCKFPKIKLSNYSGSAIVRVWLISADLDKPRAHFHKLARKPPKSKVLDLEPHDFKAHEGNNYEVTLDYLHIVHAVTNDESDINIYRKKKAHIDSDLFDPPNLVPSSGKNEKDEIKQIDKNQSLFYIQVFDERTRLQICDPIVSNKIKNLHNAETGALKIVNCSRTFGTCRGNDEVFIFVEKISKDVQVRFFRLNSHKERIWEALAIYGPHNVHHQLGIVFRTPKFEQNIEKDVQVFFELHRTNDGATSDPYSFTYKPHEDYRCNDLGKKRPHSPEFKPEEEYVPKCVSSYTSYSPKRIKDESMSPDSTTHNQNPTETVYLEPLFPIESIYPSYNVNNSAELTTINEDLDFSNILNSVDLTDLNQLRFTNCLSQDLFLDLGTELRTDSVQLNRVQSSTKDVSDEDIDEDQLPKAQIEDYSKITSTNDDSEALSNGVTKSNVKIKRIQSHSSKVDLQLAICLKRPFEEFIKVLENTTDINAVDYEGNTALHFAVKSSIKYLEPILDRGDIDKKIKNLWGDDALLDATRNGNIDIVKLLLEKEFEPNVQNSRTGETPLHLAVSDKNCPMVELLLKYGANPFLDNHSEKSAYDYAMECNVEQRRLMHFLMQESMFRKRKNACFNEAPRVSPEKDIISKLNELSVST